MVPLEAAGTSSPGTLDSVPYTASTTLCEVSTFPAATAAGGRAFSRLPGGAQTFIGSMEP